MKKSIVLLTSILSFLLLLNCSQTEDFELSPNLDNAGVAMPQVQSQYLYAHDNISHQILKVDTDTGAVTVVGPTGFNSGASGMATSRGVVEGPGGTLFDIGTHFGVLRDNDLAKDFVVVVDLITGLATKVVETSRPIGGRGIDFGPDNTTLYIIENTILSSIDTITGEITEVGSIAPYSSASLELDPDSGMFYSIAGDSVISINPADASVSLLLSKLGFSTATITRSPEGVWYSISSSDWLASIDISTGYVNMIAQVGSGGPLTIGGTAFAYERPVIIVKEISLDIKPGSCKNPVNVSSQGVTPVAIAGSENLDVTDIDVASLLLAGVTPLRSSIEDVTSTDDCEFRDPDGIDDLVLKFDTQELISAITLSNDRELIDGEVLTLKITGNTLDELSIKGSDTIFVINKKKKK